MKYAVIATFPYDAPTVKFFDEKDKADAYADWYAEDLNEKGIVFDEIVVYQRTL